MEGVMTRKRPTVRYKRRCWEMRPVEIPIRLDGTPAPLVASHPKGFELYELVHLRLTGWTNLKLTAANGLKKRNWSLGWNGVRLSRSEDAGLLMEFEPEIYDWLCATMRSLHPPAERPEDNIPCPLCGRPS
jgi:hypothetical protein